MLVSAFWHGIHPGYYLSFLTIPVCLAAEGAMDAGVRQHMGPRGRALYDWVHWFLKMRAYDYMCMGFVLLTYQDTVTFWRGLYFYIHGLALALFLLGYALSLLLPPNRRDATLSKGSPHQPAPQRPEPARPPV
eukprot:g17863.t1